MMITIKRTEIETITITDETVFDNAAKFRAYMLNKLPTLTSDQVDELLSDPYTGRLSSRVRHTHFEDEEMTDGVGASYSARVLFDIDVTG
jgi:hypothetical protein